MAEYRSGDGFDRSRNTAYQRKWRGAISRARKAKANRKKKKVLGKKGETKVDQWQNTLVYQGKARKKVPGSPSHFIPFN